MFRKEVIVGVKGAPGVKVFQCIPRSSSSSGCVPGGVVQSYD